MAMNTLQDILEQAPDAAAQPFLVELRADDLRSHGYGDLARSVRRLAWGLVREGIQPGDVVGLLAPVGAAWTVACLGALRAGAVVMPLDLQLGGEVLAGIVQDSAPRLVFTDGRRAGRLRDAGSGETPLYLLDGGDAHAGSWQNLLATTEEPLPEVATDRDAVLFYTSGTTGPPKGVPLTHDNVVFQIEAVRRTGLVRDDDRVLLPLPPHHVYPFVIGMLVPLSLGITIVLPHALTGPQLVRALQEGEATVLIGVPRLYDALSEGIASRVTTGPRTRRIFAGALEADLALRHRLGWSPGRWLLRPLRRRFAARLRMVASGGAPLSPDTARRLEALGWPVAVGYGLTETSPLLTVKRPDDPHDHTVGRPIAGVEIRIDPDALAEAGSSGSSAGEGEILARGPNVFAGYRNLPDETRAAFTGDGWFRTGDLGRRDDDGYLHLSGRVSTLIVTRGGENVQPDTVENHLARHPSIAEAGVLQGEDGGLAAVVVPEREGLRDRGPDDPDRAVRQALDEASRELPSYQRVTDFVVIRSPLPRTRLGKIRRHRLAEVFAQARTARHDPDREPRGPVDVADMPVHDRTLLEDPAADSVWRWLADRYRNRRLSPDTSLELDLGVDSLEWMNLTLEIRRITGQELAEDAIAEIDTVRDLLVVVSDRTSHGAGAEAPESPLEEPEQVLSAAQRRWLEPLSPGDRRLARALFALTAFLVRHGFRLRVRGLANLPEGEPYILAPNHVSYLDPLVLAAALGFERLRGVYWTGFTGAAFRNRLLRQISRLARAVPVDPELAVVSSMAFAAAVLKRRHGLVWFPEGRRSPDGRLQPFKSGLGMLLARYPVPVVPAFIRGTEAILPPGRALPRPGAVTVVFGEAVAPGTLVQNGHGDEERERIASALHDEVAALGRKAGVT